MRRKSERNKAKGSPEKKTEKPTRKSTRRRGKRSTSSSPERDNSNDKTSSVDESSKESTQAQVRLKFKDADTIASEAKAAPAADEPAEAEGKSKAEDVEVGGSVWKVARADASPGEIQKLKLCRQRNTSEASDNSQSARKRSNKWQESGEGDGEEVDSTEEQPGSCEGAPGGARPDDPSSSRPGQDSNEEVSDRKEILPETTSADLSDAKPNIDQQGDSNEASCVELNIDMKKSPKSCGAAAAPSSNGDDREEQTPQKEEMPMEGVNEETAEEEEVVVEEMVVEEEKKEKTTEEPRRESSSDEEKEKARSESSNDEAAAAAKTPPPLRSSRRKHRAKYRDSSDSESQDSEEEQRNAAETSSRTALPEEKESPEARSRTPSPVPRANSSTPNHAEAEREERERVEKPETDGPGEKADDAAISKDVATVNRKPPAKVNLKRSFSARVSVDAAETRKDDVDGNFDSDSANQNKENLSAGEQDEAKSIPRKRRWGTALSTDAAPAFSVSTDSLKALVPGAKPLPINEVRLSKDDDDESDRRRDREKRYVTTDGGAEYRTREDGLRGEGGKKGDAKNDNHIAARRKISIVKDAPHLKSPSPPASKPTNILLIKNLVRPFTLNQIKELLSRTGTIADNGFWMDGIKSKCFVEYANEDQAFETRQALHGISWPVSNPKRLQVEYASKEDMELARELSKDQPIPRKTEPLAPSDAWQQEWMRDERTNSTKVTIVREWDLGKEDGPQHAKEKERDKKDHEKKRRQRSRSPALEAHLPPPARKFKKKEDEPPPAKLLDDLFRKTKATPCIYWLPLTNEQIVVKEEMRRQHMAEHARRLEEMRRAERSRDGRRRRSPRK